MANDVKVVIELKKAAPKAGFGYPLIFAGKQQAAVAYKEVSSIEEVKTAGFAETTSVYKAAQLLFMQNDAPAKIAVCGSTDTAVAALPGILGEGWRQLIVVSLGTEGESKVDAISDYIEGCGKPAMFFTHVNPADDATEITAMEGNDRTVAIAYESSDTACPEAALVGATAGLDVGSFTYKNIILKGVTAQEYTDSEVETQHGKGVITILKKAGSIVTSEGITLSKEYADIVDSKDYIIQQIEYQCQYLLNRMPKLPYDNRGIASLEGVVVSVLMDAANNGMIAVTDDGDYDYSVDFGGRSECAASDISTRHYAEGQFEFALAGAIHTAKIKGSIIA
nr:MAG TPA: tail sheath protein [Caudoviricetes sp.]